MPTGKVYDPRTYADLFKRTLKAADQLEWVQQMNNIRSRVTEIVNAELIYQ